MSRHDHELRLNDWFCGAGGSTQGLARVPGVRPVHAANHWDLAIDSHAANFPDVDHRKDDVKKIDVGTLPYAELFWASPECTNWSKAKGKKQNYAIADTALPGLEEPAAAESEQRSRALMEEVPQYLRAMARRGRPVLAGVVENVTDVRKWTDWQRWRSEIEAIGYRTRLIALNSMHAQSQWTPRAPQSRDRLYLAYWHVSIGRDPDWDKWLRPRAWCARCDTWVAAVQVWKTPGQDMGKYRQQYVYRCPNASCRMATVEPAFAPAWTAIDWSVRGERIGDRAKPLAPKTLMRIEAGIRKFARPVVVEAGGHQYDAADPKHRQHGTASGYYRSWPVEEPLRTLHTAMSKGVVVPPLMVPVEGRDGKTAVPAQRPMRTQSTRNETAVVVPPMVVPLRTNGTASTVDDPLKTFVAGNVGMAAVVPPFVAELRGGGSVARPIDEPLATFSAGGTHHGLVVAPGAIVIRNNGSRGDGGEMSTSVEDALRTLTTAGHQSLVTWGWDEWAALYRYDSPEFGDLTRALPTQTTIQGDALVHGTGLPAVDDCLFRMLEPHEIGAGMAFRPDYIVLGNKRDKVAQYGNAVTPPVSEILGCALVECITGQAIDTPNDLLGAAA